MLSNKPARQRMRKKRGQMLKKNPLRRRRVRKVTSGGVNRGEINCSSKQPAREVRNNSKRDLEYRGS